MKNIKERLMKLAPALLTTKEQYVRPYGKITVEKSSFAILLRQDTSKKSLAQAENVRKNSIRTSEIKENGDA